MKRLIIIFAVLLVTTSMMAQTRRQFYFFVQDYYKEDIVQVGDLYYNIIHDKNGYYAEVISNDSYKSLQSVTIPNSIPYRRGVLPVTSIGEKAFTDCKSLTAISIPSSITRIRRGFMPQSQGAFDGTGIYNDSSNWKDGALCIDGCLIEVSKYLPNTYKISNDVRLIADFVFQNCS